MKSKVSIVKCNSYESGLVFESTKRAINLLGGIESFINPGASVLVKPNLLMAKEPESGIDTHPEVVRAVVKILKEISCKVIVGDSPSVFDNQMGKIDEVYERSGIKRICDEEGVSLVKFDKRRWHGKFPLASWLDECEHLVSVPKFKTHNLTLITAAIKNLFGLVVGTYKMELHKNYFNTLDFTKMLVDIYEEVKPDLTVIDGIIAMEGDGPATSGKLRTKNLLFAGRDCVALDSVLSVIMGVKPFDVPTNKEASDRGLGISDIDSIEILGEQLEDIADKPFLLPSTSTLKRKLPKPVIDLAKRLIKYYPCVERDNCIQCAVCINSCPSKAITMRKEEIVFDYSKCIACFCCQENCPNSAIKVKKSVLARLMGL